MEINIYLEIEKLIRYALDKKLIMDEDVVYARNRVLDVLKLHDYHEIDGVNTSVEYPNSILNKILEWAYKNKRIEYNSTIYRDLLDTRIMDCFIPRPSQVITEFYENYKKNPMKATDYYYQMSQYSNYIRTDRIKKNMIWKASTSYGDLDITINLSKPEKDPRAIEAARKMKHTSYPQCLLCKENEGYSGRVNHPARNSHRIIPIELKGEKWFLQYSPYSYYNEHCILLKGKHDPMRISKDTFDKLLIFVEKFPHYFIGSNADLPIVGGSILSHDHFQGGNYEFAMEKAPIDSRYTFQEYPSVEAGILKWPMSVIRIRGKEKDKLCELAGVILEKWRAYSDYNVGVYAFSEDIPHNTITPIARMGGELFELDLVLRNNRTDKEHPLGIFHPHTDVHHIKKENIGLIEVMGLAVLPARLKGELELIESVLLRENMEATLKEQELEKHEHWIEQIRKKYKNINKENVTNILKEEIGVKFMTVLEYAGVFKRNDEGREAFLKFLKSVDS
ncbi:UDP-glucose--hexose-1-phosphate uridylyltransferase [Oceanirhabdus sp. W0125-5]|uniref:UDP-glucose--hexose-1-phosphate uridylyltransferase n=1 Tax=Oceanirhabdus sp. W0125-5 TaxID=2999116 RepID=UPI0022F30643|nr:UDP-glucose--hexose-1-phosphate uridylyltransferase [Oceanirhabdus sp. W0125-5]WBW97372.1 UDP-glucose--hexose-1-phosphate uridylyltransferase [Oceanirhabdus sp. W0125-5]